MSKKIIYKDKYEELMKNFEKIVENNIPFSHIRTNYSGWTQLLHRLEKLDCKTIEVGNLGYCIGLDYKFLNDNLEKAIVYLTDTDKDCKEYLNNYYQINIYYNDGVLKKDFIKSCEYKSNFNDYKDFWATKHLYTCCDFYYYYQDCFIVLTRHDGENLYYLFCFGYNSQEKLKLLLDGVEFHKIESNLLDDLKYLYDEYIFNQQDNSAICEKIGNMILSAIKINNFDDINLYLEKDIIYTSNTTYGFEEYSGLQIICDEIIKAKEIINIKMKHNSENEIMFFAKIKTNDNKIKNKLFSVKFNHNQKIYYMEEWFEEE